MERRVCRGRITQTASRSANAAVACCRLYFFAVHHEASPDSWDLQLRLELERLGPGGHVFELVGDFCEVVEFEWIVGPDNQSGGSGSACGCEEVDEGSADDSGSDSEENAEVNCGNFAAEVLGGDIADEGEGEGHPQAQAAELPAARASSAAGRHSWSENTARHAASREEPRSKPQPAPFCLEEMGVTGFSRIGFIFWRSRRRSVFLHFFREVSS
jgi:hypothetical protein